MRTIHSIVVGAIVATTALLAFPASSMASPVAPYYAITLDDGGLNLPGRALDSSNATFTKEAWTSSAIDLNASESNITALDFSLNNTDGSALAVGTYATVGDNMDNTRLVMTIGVSSCTDDGSVTILELTSTSFAATYSIPECSIQGEVRWNSAIGYKSASASQGGVGFYADAGFVSVAHTLRFTGTGTDPITFGHMSITGPAGTFVVTADSCSGATLGFGQTCAITMHASEATVGIYTGVLTIPDNSNSGSRIVPLNLNSVPGDEGTYYPISPTRVVDTRDGTGSYLGVPRGALKTGGTIHMKVSTDVIPGTHASAVVLNVTVLGSKSNGFLTVYPTGQTRPTASSLNYTAGWTGANSVTVGTGASHSVDIYSSAGNPQVIVDIVGFFAGDDAVPNAACLGVTCGPGGQYQPVVIQRLLDTRTALHGAKLPGGSFITIPVNYGSAVNLHLKALAVNVTAVSPKASGYLTAWGGNSPLGFPKASTLNYSPGRNVPNMAVIPVEACSGCGAASGLPSISVFASATTDVLVDIVGIFDDGTLPGGLRFMPQTPNRVADSRSGTGVAGPLGAGDSMSLAVPSADTIADAQALALNVTAVAPTVSTFLTVWPTGSNLPGVSNLNPSKGQTVANATITAIGTGNAISVYNYLGTTNFLVDVVGSYYVYLPASSEGASPFSKTKSGAALLHETLQTPVSQR